MLAYEDMIGEYIRKGCHHPGSKCIVTAKHVFKKKINGLSKYFDIHYN